MKLLNSMSFLLLYVALIPSESITESLRGVNSTRIHAPMIAEEAKNQRDLMVQITAKLVGDDGKPSSAFPLGECQGDCDDDNDCKPGLYCLHRSSNSQLPSPCVNPAIVSTSKDLCVKKTGGVADHPKSSISWGGAAFSSTFFLKMYWEPGYKWQEDPVETFWCIGCVGKSCDPNDNMIITDCKNKKTTKATRLQFVTFDDKYLIRIRNNPSLCMENNGVNNDYQAKVCNITNTLQHFLNDGVHLGTGKFELRPSRGKGSHCLTQRHHPREGEIVRAERCETPRKITSNTSYWVKY